MTGAIWTCNDCGAFAFFEQAAPDACPFCGDGSEDGQECDEKEDAHCDHWMDGEACCNCGKGKL